MYNDEMKKLHKAAAALRRKAERLQRTTDGAYYNVNFHLAELVSLAAWIDHHADAIERN